MALLRLTFRLTLFVLFLLACALTLLLLRLGDALWRHRLDRTRPAQLYLRVLCRLMGVRVKLHGQPGSGTRLLVCNHVSWFDIPVLASCMPLRFLAKQEIASWPVVGWMGRQIGTLFIQRGGGKSAQVREQIAEALCAGDNLLIFPEGTTSDGAGVLPFHGRLLLAASDAKRPVQAISIRYSRQGQRDTLAPFINQDSFEKHLVRLLRKPAMQVDLVFHPPIPDTTGISAETLAKQLHAQTTGGLRQLEQADVSAREVALPEVPPRPRVLF